EHAEREQAGEDRAHARILGDIAERRQRLREKGGEQSAGHGARHDDERRALAGEKKGDHDSRQHAVADGIAEQAEPAQDEIAADERAREIAEQGDQDCREIRGGHSDNSGACTCPCRSSSRKRRWASQRAMAPRRGANRTDTKNKTPATRMMVGPVGPLSRNSRNDACCISRSCHCPTLSSTPKAPAATANAADRSNMMLRRSVQKRAAAAGRINS